MRELDLALKMLRQLVDVLDYLHHNQVLHYDLIPANVMIAAGMHNVMLIELDEALYLAFDKTQCDVPWSRVGAGREKTPDVDFMALGRFVENCIIKVSDDMGVRKFRDLYAKPGITAQELRNVLDHGHEDVFFWAVVA